MRALAIAITGFGGIVLSHHHDRRCEQAASNQESNVHFQSPCGNEYFANGLFVERHHKSTKFSAKRCCQLGKLDADCMDGDHDTLNGGPQF